MLPWLLFSYWHLLTTNFYAGLLGVPVLRILDYKSSTALLSWVLYCLCGRDLSVHISMMHSFRYLLLRLSRIQILMLIISQCLERIFIAKAIHKMHICILYIFKSRHFYCCYCPWHQSVITVFLLSVLPQTLSTKPPSSDDSSTERYHHKYIVTQKWRWIWRDVTFSALGGLSNILLQNGTRALNCPVYLLPLVIPHNCWSLQASLIQHLHLWTSQRNPVIIHTTPYCCSIFFKYRLIRVEPTYVSYGLRLTFVFPV